MSSKRIISNNMQQTYCPGQYFRLIHSNKALKPSHRLTLRSAHSSHLKYKPMRCSAKHSEDLKAPSVASLSRFNSPMLENQVKVLEAVSSLIDASQDPGVGRLASALEALTLITEDSKAYKSELELAVSEIKRSTLLPNESLSKDLSDIIYEENPGKD